MSVTRSHPTRETLAQKFGLSDRACKLHGGLHLIGSEQCQTDSVLAEVAHERAGQFLTYGTNNQLANGTGPETAWLLPLTAMPATAIEENFRQDYEDFEEEVGYPTWAHLVREEVAEAFAESDPAKLRGELLQVAALCVSWIEKIDYRQHTGQSAPQLVTGD